MERMTVKQLASRAEIPVDTVRYYLREGLVPEPTRAENGYRQFGPEAVDRLVFIKRAQRLGLRLDAIRQLLEASDNGDCPCGAIQQKLSDRLAEIDQELTALSELRHEIAALIADPPPALGASASGCPPAHASLRSVVDAPVVSA